MVLTPVRRMVVTLADCAEVDSNGDQIYVAG
jgi:hypothetical protein